MKKCLLILICFVIVSKGFSQNERFSNQVGVSGLPIYDLLNLFPENDIAGGAINFNYGRFIGDNLSFGLNFYLANASNKYSTSAADSHKEEQSIAFQGLNSNLRYNRNLTKRLSAFGIISFGFGNFQLETTNLSTNLQYASDNESMAMLMAGPGLNYFVSKQLAIELNIPYVFMNRFSTKPYVENFHGIAPMIGIQYYW